MTLPVLSSEVELLLWTHQDGRRYQGRANVIVCDDRYIGAGGGLDAAFIMVEAMEPGKKFEGTEPEGWIEHFQKIGDLPKYESARSVAEHSPFKVILNPSEPDGIQTGLQPLTRDKFREVLGNTRSGCHSILQDNEGLQSQEAVDAMVKFLFAKWYDEMEEVIKRICKINSAKRWDYRFHQRKFSDVVVCQDCFAGCRGLPLRGGAAPTPPLPIRSCLTKH